VAVEDLDEHATVVAAVDGGPEGADGVAADPAAEDDLDVVGPAEVEVVDDEGFEEAAGMSGRVEDDGAGDLDLAHGAFPPVASVTVGAGQWKGEAGQPPFDEEVDGAGAEPVADGLQRGRGGAEDPALRFGDPRVMALTGASCQTLLAATGFTNTSLRAVIAGLGGSDYRPGQMAYDLRRLRLAGPIQRPPRCNRYVLTADGIRIAVFYTKLYNRLLVPLTATDQPQAPADLRAALATITHHVDDYAAALTCPAPRET
jgi:hypothetical protein